MKHIPIKDNPYCLHCKRKYCKNKKRKDCGKDHNLGVEADTIRYLSKTWGICLKQTKFEFCPLDFYSPDLPLMGDVTTPSRKWIYPLTEKWATPGWVVDYFKLSTLIDSASCVGLMSFYVWAFEDGVKCLSAIDIINKIVDTMHDELTIKEDLHQKPESSHMPRSKGIYINPHRLRDPLFYLSSIEQLMNYYQHNIIIDGTDELEQATNY